MKCDSRLIRAAGNLEALKASLVLSKDFREILIKVLTAELESVIINSESEEVASDLNLLVHLNGQRNALRKTLNLLKDPE